MFQAQATATTPPTRARSFYDKEVQAIVWQAVFLAIVLGIGYYLFSNMQANLARQNVSTGFDYLARESGFGIGESWIEYSPAATYARALLVGFLNTIAVAIVGVVLATTIGISIGVASLSKNWLVRQVTGVYIHFLRNIPVLLQIILWHTLITNERFVDTAAALVHLGNFGAFAERFLAALSPVRFTVFGSPSAEVKEAAAGFGPAFYEPVGGFIR